MLKGWEVKKLREVCEIKPPKKEAKNKLKETDLVSFLPMEDLGILTKEVCAVQERQLKDVSGSYTYFADNDVLLAKITPCFENGKIGIARSLKNGIGFGSSEYVVFRLNGEIIPDYLYYFLSRPQFRQEGEKMMMGAVGHKRVSKDFIENYVLPFPKSITEQRRIVTILDEAFSAIAKAKENAEKNLQNARELFESYLQNVFANPGECWEEKRLGQICKIDKIPNRKKNLPYVGMEHIESNSGKFIGSREPQVVKSLTFNFSEKHLLYGRLRPYLNKTLLPDFEGHCSTEIFPILPNQDLDRRFLFYWLTTERTVTKINATCTGARMPRANMNAVLDFEIFLPPFTEQQAIISKLDLLSAETKKLEAIYQQKLVDLEELKKSILQKAFAGELHTDRLAA